MIVIPLVFAIAAGLATKVNSFPASDVAFPKETNGVEDPESGLDRYYQGPQQHPYINQQTGQFRPLGPNRPVGYSTNIGSGLEGQYPRPQFSRPGGEFNRPMGSRPIGNFRPQGTFQQFSPSFFRPEGNTRPQFSSPQNSGFNEGSLVGSSSGDYSGPEGINTDNNPKPNSFEPDFLAIDSGVQESDGSAQAESTTTTTETTTKIPRRNPTYRIIYTVSCPCSYTRQYEPVCGTDGQTYGNIGILQCAQTCGSSVKVFLNGSCGRNNGHPGAISLKY